MHSLIRIVETLSTTIRWQLHMGHSKTTSTRFWLFWTTYYPPALTFSMVWTFDNKWTFLDHLPTSSCKRSLWTDPKSRIGQEMSALFIVSIKNISFQGRCLNQLLRIFLIVCNNLIVSFRIIPHQSHFLCATMNRPGALHKNSFVTHSILQYQIWSPDRNVQLNLIFLIYLCILLSVSNYLSTYLEILQFSYLCNVVGMS